MKKVLASFIICTYFFIPAFCDSWDDFSNIDRMWDGQKTITNQDFEKVMDALEEEDNKKEEKQKKKKLKRFGGGKSLHKELNPDFNIQNVEITKPSQEGIVLNVPVTLVVNETILEKGFYKVIGERKTDSNKILIKFYQSQFLKAEVEVIETNDDFNEESIDFAKILPYNDSFVKMIFGSIDFNAYIFLPYLNK